MSKTVDERVVEMRFDNSQFEKNVSTTMSTLDKFKQKLNLSGAAKGLDEVSSAAKRVDMSGLSSGIESVRVKFSALEVASVTALANLTNSAVNAGKRMLSALTLDPVKDGFNEYETQMNAVQTILANTQKEGANVKTVNKALDELNTYADKTIYNFTEMTRNIGTFTAAGVKLDTSVSAIKGIANLAAVSGSTSQQASTAMYQLSQAIASGTVKLMDWNSVVNAGMGGQVFQDALIRTSEHLKTGAKAAIDAKGSFRESLQTGWLTTEVLTQTLDQFSTAADTQEEYEAAVKKFVEQGYSQEEAKQMADMAKTAGDAATKVKTFTQLIDTLKEALGSGWTKTWQLIIGDFEEAKEFWTGVSDVLSGFINGISDARNTLLESALGKGFDSLTEKMLNIIKPIKKITSTVGNATNALDDLDNIADSVINQTFGNGQERIDALTESGKNYYRVQNKVNEKLGESFRYTDEQVDAQDKLLGIQIKSSDETAEETKETVKLTEEKKNLIKEIASMTNEQMRSKGYTDEQIDTFNELGRTADKLGIPLNEFIDNMDQINGRWLLLNSFKNIGKSIISIFSSIGKAWRSIFDPMSSDALFDIIAGFHKFTSEIETFTEGNADKLMRTFKGLFAALDIVRSIAGGGLKIAFKVLSVVLGEFNMTVLDFTAMIGDAIVALRNFLKENDPLTKSFNLLGDGIKMVIKAFKALYNTISGLPRVQEFVKGIQGIDLFEIGKNIIAGLNNGLKDGITSIPQVLAEIGIKLLEAIKGVLGIHSPSTEMYDVGKYSIAGLVNGLKDGSEKVFNVISYIGSKMLERIKEFNWSKAFAVAASTGLLLIVKKMVGVIDNVTEPLKGLGSLLSGVGSVLDSVSNVIDKSSKSIKKILNNTAKVVKGFANILNAQAFKMKASAIKDLAISLLMLSAAVSLLAQLDTGKLWSSVGAIIALSAVLLALAVAMDKFASTSATIDKNGFNLKGLKTGLINIGIAIVLISSAVKMMGSMNPDQAKQGFLGLAGVVASIAILVKASDSLIDGKSAKKVDKAGRTIKKMASAIRQIAITLLIMVAVIKLVSMLKTEELAKGAAFAAGFLVFVTLLVKISKTADKKIDKLGLAMMHISIAMLLMVGTVKIIGQLSKKEMVKGIEFAAAFIIFIKVLMKITKADEGQEFAKLGALLLSVSLAMTLMAGVVKLIGRLSNKEMIKGAAFAVAFTIFIKNLIAITKIGSEEKIAKVTGTILAVSIAIGIMAGVCILLGLIDIGALAKGIIAVGALGYILSLMVKSTKGASDVKGDIIAMSVAIGVMAASIAILSFINPKKLVGPVLAMTMLMGMFTLIEKAGSSITGSMGTLITMTVAIGVMAGAILLLSFIPIEKALGAAASLSVLMLSFSVAMKIVGSTGTVAQKALIAIGVMTVIVGALAGILHLLGNMDPASSIANATSLSVLLLAMSACCLLLTAVGAAGPAALIGVASLGALIVGVSGIVIALGALTEHFPKIEEFLNKGIPVLEKIGYALGSFFGNIIGGFSAGVTSGLPEIATNLSIFMTNLQPFIDSAKQVDQTALTGITSLVKMVALISGAKILNSIATFITGSSSMNAFASQLDKFADAIISFSAKVKGNIDESSVLAAANAGKMMAEMASSIPGTGGVVQWFTGEKDMAMFGDQLLSFGDAIVKFSNKVSEGINEDAVIAAANAGKIMAEMQRSIVPSGGVVQWFTGEKDMATFGTQLVIFGNAIVAFSKKVSEGISEEAITAAANAGKIMIEMQKSIVPSGGVVQWFTGEKDMAEFGSQLVVFGDAIMQFSEKVSGGVNEDAVAAAANAGKIMTSLQNSIPEKHWFDGKVTLDDFGKNIVKFGEGIQKYSEKVSGINVDAISSSLSAAKKLVSITKSIVNLDSSGISEFKKVSGIGEAISGYSKKISSVNFDGVSSSISSIKELVSFINSLYGLNPDGISTFKEAIDSLAQTNLNGIAEAFEGSISELESVGSDLSDALANGFEANQSSVTSAAINVANAMHDTLADSSEAFNSVGKNLIDNLVSGISDQKDQIAWTTSSGISSAASEATDYYDSFYDAGSYLVSGFANGISDNTYRAEAESIAMAEAAYEAARETLDIHSPSRVFRKLGIFVTEGFAQGIDRMSKCVKDSSNNMAKTAIDGTENALSYIANVINGDIDVQPTIRPVLDLSDVKSGAGSLSRMFNDGGMINLRANANSISSMMNHNRQNGSNDDVISAINKLNKSLNNLEKPSYVINGVTYDNGSNISNAVESLVRAARIERRI